MRKIKFVLLLFVVLATFTSCTDNQSVKGWGGTADFEMPAGQKLINVTWKNNELWYLTREMTDKDSCESYKFQEKSSWGIMEGTYLIKETR